MAVARVGAVTCLCLRTGHYGVHIIGWISVPALVEGDKQRGSVVRVRENACAKYGGYDVVEVCVAESARRLWIMTVIGVSGSQPIEVGW